MSKDTYYLMGEGNVPQYKAHIRGCHSDIKKGTFVPPEGTILLLKSQQRPPSIEQEQKYTL